MPSRHTAPLLLAWSLTLGVAVRPAHAQVGTGDGGAALGAADRGNPAAPVVAGLARSKLPPRVRGLVLLGELGCVGCHRHEGPDAIEARVGPDLTNAGTRVRAAFLRRFLADPGAVQVGTVMPDVLRGRPEPAAAAEALAHYLRSFGTGVPASARAASPFDAAAAQRGRALFHSIGCVACHPPRDSKSQELGDPGTVSLAHVGAKYEVDALRAFLLAPHLTHPARRMPDFRLAPREALELSAYLRAGDRVGEPVAPAPDPQDRAAPDPAKVATGRALFAERGCAQCHELADPARASAPAAAPLTALDATRGCLSGQPGAWPHYPLTATQRADLAAALAELGAPLDEEMRIQQRLAARNCAACHERNGHGGVRPEFDVLCASDEPSLGQDGRLPPPLTGVGAKLQEEWLLDAIAQGQAERPYLRTRMPGFGAACAEDLAARLARTDTLAPMAVMPLPRDEAGKRAVLELGRELVGEKGMNCIACHRFAGEQIGGMGAIDLVHTTGRRLRPEWFAHYVRAPARFKPSTIMPLFFPDGVTVRPELGGGDTARQIDALWHYLAAGRNGRKPAGLRPAPIELAVGDEAVLLRRSVQRTGKRGISVGYPHGVNLTFDAERLGLDQIWWGGFVDAAPVWTGQGSGEARILGQERVELPPGPGIVALAAAEAPWPTATRRELGQRWLGYDLDAAQRPSFRYVVRAGAVDVEVEDAPREVLGASDAAGGTASRPRLRRSLRFAPLAAGSAAGSAAGATEAGSTEATLWLRAARAARVEDRGGGVVEVGASLRLDLGGATYRIHADGAERELRVAVPLRAGHATLTLEYTWRGDGR